MYVKFVKLKYANDVYRIDSEYLVECDSVTLNREQGFTSVSFVRANGSLESVVVKDYNLESNDNYNVAYIENDQGKTLQTVKQYH